ncbi:MULTISPECIES: glycosyltransferase family 2 protein [Chitinophagaceae]
MTQSLSIIIINYNSAALIKGCLQSFVYSSRIAFDIIIVNNGKSNEDELSILKSFPQVKWINMGYNAGFARANNEGIRQSTGDAVLLLNPDTLILDNAIDHVLNRFAKSSYVACGVQLLNEDGTPQISGNYAMKGGLNYLLPLPYIGNFLKWLGEIIKIKKPNIPDATDTVEVDWINGAFLMVKRNVLSEAGLLDEDFFLYAEEAEWCSRLKKIGKLCIYGDCKVTHLQGESSNEAFNSEGKGYYNLYDRKGLQIMLSNFVRIRKEFGLFWFFVDLFVYILDIPVFFLFGIIENVFRLRDPFRHFKKWSGYTLNVCQLWRYVPIIVSNKPYFYKIL